MTLGSAWRRKGYRCGAMLVLGIGVLLLTVSIDYHGHQEGVYLLRGETKALELTDDIMLGEEEKILAGMSWDVVRSRLGIRSAIAYGEPHLESEWFTSDGSGYVRNIYPDGRQLLTCFSRFQDTDKRVPQGLFVGGGLPYHEHSDKKISMNDTGMAYYDGKEWHHIWCNVNESIAVGLADPTIVPPSKWGFEGSRIIQSDPQRVVLETSHSVVQNGTQLHIDRYAVFRAGENFFTLIFRIKNVGKTPGTYFYVYGDEPWVGEYGTSGGNVGWSKDRIYRYESEIDVKTTDFAGMYDVGNSAAGDHGNYTGLADFIQWLSIPPDVAYFSNKIGTFSPESAKIPLASPDNRVIFLQWGPRLLAPGEADVYALAVGMAEKDPKTGMPVKPQVTVDSHEVMSFLAH